MSHKCHWPGCDKEINPQYWGCVPHLLLLPSHIKQSLWKYYRYGGRGSKTSFPVKMAYKRAHESALEFAQAWEVKGGK